MRWGGELWGRGGEEDRERSRTGGEEEERWKRRWRRGGERGGEDGEEELEERGERGGGEGKRGEGEEGRVGLCVYIIVLLQYLDLIVM
jgi:hypothetical protein